MFTFHFEMFLFYLVDQLTNKAMKQRSLHAYHQPTAVNPRNDHERQIFFLSQLWNISRDILEYNFQRILSINNLITKNRIHRFSTTFQEEYLSKDEYSIALEFFLQIDIDTFYMKTCSYRGASLETNQKLNIFLVSKPNVSYEMKQCHQNSCCLCYPNYKMTYRNNQTVVYFGSNQQHYFLNGYRSILNCPATCTTRNIIYVLTCPCHQADYIGETSLSLADRLTC